MNEKFNFIDAVKTLYKISSIYDFIYSIRNAI